MSVTRAIVRAAARQMIQDANQGLGVGVQQLLSYPDDYNTCIAQALRQFESDVPNRRFVHYVMPSTTFRFVLGGTGAILVPQPPPLAIATIIGTSAAGVYSYRIAARNGAGQGLWTDAVSVTTGPATLDSSHKIQLDWAAVPGATSYDVFGRTPLGELLMSNVGGTTFTDDGTLTPAGALGTTGLDGWWYDGSQLDQVWMPYFAGTGPLAAQGQDPVDENSWRVLVEPGSLVILEFLDINSTVGQTLRLEFTSPHSLDENSAAYTSITARYVEAIKTCVAAHLLRMVANKYIQNAGTTGLPNDVVDRRSQSDQAASRAKEYFAIYQNLVAAGESPSGTSGFLDLNVQTTHNRGMLWHPSRIR